MRRNFISGNQGDGIRLTAGAFSNTVEGNSIGTDVGGSIPLGNLGDGIEIDNNTSNTIGGTNNTIGGTAAGAGNIIRNNDGNGINLTAGALGNLVQGNSIRNSGRDGLALAGMTTTNNTIGGAAAGAPQLHHRERRKRDQSQRLCLGKPAAG